MSKSPEYTFTPKPITMAERSDTARNFWLGKVGDDQGLQAVVEAEFGNTEIKMTEDRLFNIAKELQSLRMNNSSE